MSAYSSTSVSVASSQDSIRTLLRRFDADGFSFREQAANVDGADTRVVAMEFTHNGHFIRMLVALKPPDENEIAAKTRRARTKTYEVIRDEGYAQEERRIWRVLFHGLKARLVAVEEKVETFEQAFLAHLVDPATNRTLYETMRPAIDAGAFLTGGDGVKALPAPGENQ